MHTCSPARGGSVSMRSWREEPTREPAHADALGRRLSPSRHKFRERASPIACWPRSYVIRSTSLWSQQPPDRLWTPSRPIASGPTSPPPSATHALAQHPPPDRSPHLHTQTPFNHPPWHRFHSATASPCWPRHGSTPRRRQLHVADPPQRHRQPEQAHTDHASGPEQLRPPIPDSTRPLALPPLHCFSSPYTPRA